MRLAAARRWLAVYFLLITVFTGGYLLLFGETSMLPMPKQDAMAAFQILVPVLIAQITLIFQWISQLSEPEDQNAFSPIPAWAIKLPAILVAALIVASVLLLAFGNMGEGQGWGLSPQDF